MDALADEALMSQVAVGETRALGVLIRRYRGQVYGSLLRATGRSSDAEDLFQETWIRVGQRAHTFDPSRSFAPWLGVVTTRVAIDWSRSADRRASSEGFDEEAASAEANAEQRLGQHHDQRRVAHALEQLPEHMRAAILLRYFHELTEREVSARLGIPTGTVKSRVHNGLKALRDALEGASS
jgi:RNA polymerase sigma-70 factor (ECF subfamily)